MQRAQVPGGMADAAGQRGAIQIDALAGVNLGLAIERQMVGIFGDQNLGDRGLGRQAALDQPCWRRGLRDTVLASPAGIFGSPGEEHPELRRHDVQPLTPVLANPVQLTLAARAGLVVNVDDDLDPRQMRRQRSPVDPALVSPGLPLQSRCIIGLRGKVRLGLLDVFETQQHLVFGQRLRPAAKAMALHFLDDLTQPLVLHSLGE